MKSRLSMSSYVVILAIALSVTLAVAPVCHASPGAYVVQKGDTLNGIAARYGLSASQLAQANGLAWNAWVYVGQRLTIPDPQPESATSYTVQRGDTLYRIARRTGTTVQAIIAANNLRSNLISVGQRLVIPTPDSRPTSPTAWESYVNPGYGFSFQYPATWIIEEAENLVRLRQGPWLFAVAFWRHDEDVSPPWTGMPAGDMRNRGKMMFLGQEIDKNALVYQDKVKVLTYSADTGSLVFSVRLDDVGTVDYETIEIAGSMQGEVDQIMSSFRMSSAGPTPRPPTPPAAIERIRFAPGATQGTVEGHLATNGAKDYVLSVAAEQFIEMDATVVGLTGQGLRFSIVGADGTVIKPMGDAHIRTVAPSSQDYYVKLMSNVGAVDYRMSVLIPVRIRFAPGAISAQVEGYLEANDTCQYVLRARAGQRMLISPLSTQSTTGLTIAGADGQVLLSGHVGQPGYVYDGILPTSQDYLISVRAQGGTGSDYILGISIYP